VSVKALSEKDYVLGTEDAEVERLGVQHLVWRPRAADAWRRAGFTTGQHLIDIGCGPGYATVDLAAIVGATGRITAVDQSARFLERVAVRAASAGLTNIERIHRDLDSDALPRVGADGAWCRWVFAFLNRPRELLAGISDALKPGAALAIHEYFNYASWRLTPREPDFEEFVQVVMSSWRASGGEPDIGLDLLSWLPLHGFRIEEVRPIIDIVAPDDFIWRWPSTFVEVGVSRLAALGHFSSQRAAEVKELFRRAQAAPDTRMVTPGVVEIIARKV
jgi:SAM-dependent methyltransferase